MKVSILYGTESGNAELVADDVAESLEDSNVTIEDLQDADVLALSTDTLYLIICSTHGEGNLPESAQPFAEALEAEKPDLQGIRFAMFGLGDSTYEHYSRGSEHIDHRLRALGATRVGEYGRHDASSRSSASEVAVAWAAGVLANSYETTPA
ncbi:flavodoxin domain-containing protein [Paenarthrobacter nitroguajacolicus]|uniref:flavodoxin domain-containing protein n=1 Tax=Paenarthrobacter nitroguajacolicus TaxID=211146 RepID=UPI000A8038D6|nr:flavodoxin domain-containing protein [Paenarthrobacter nitroguajacolicus]